MNEIFDRLCTIIKPLINDQDLKREFDLALNKDINEIEVIIYGYIRLEIEQVFAMEIPMELQILIMRYTKFDIYSELPFTLKMLWGFNGKKEIINNPEILSLNKSIMTFEVFWDDDRKCDAKYYKMENRIPVQVDSFDAAIPFPIFENSQF